MVAGLTAIVRWMPSLLRGIISPYLPTATVLVLAWAVSLTAGIGCNSDEIPSGLVTTDDDPTFVETTLEPETTDDPTFDIEETTAEPWSCRESLDCLKFCKLYPLAEADQACILNCTAGLSIDEFLYGLDLGLCAADLCAMGDSCDPMMPTSDECLGCAVTLMVGDEPPEGCESEYLACN